MKKFSIATINDSDILSIEEKKSILGGSSIIPAPCVNGLRDCTCDVYGEHTSWYAATCARSEADAEQIIRSRSKRIIDSITCYCSIDAMV